MTAQFLATGFDLHGGYLTYRFPGAPLSERPRFIARFKIGGAADFRKFLTKNFTPAEYFGRIDAGEAPLTILESKGYVLPHIRKWLREAGLPETPAGQRELVQRQMAARRAS